MGGTACTKSPNKCPRHTGYRPEGGERHTAPEKGENPSCLEVEGFVEKGAH